VEVSSWGMFIDFDERWERKVDDVDELSLASQPRWSLNVSFLGTV